MKNTLETLQSTAEQIALQIAQTESKTREFSAEIEVAQAELKAARAKIDFTQPKTVTLATSAQNKVTVLGEAKADLERELVELGEQHVQTEVAEAHAAKLARIGELAAAAIGNRAAYDEARQRAAETLRGMRDELMQIGGQRQQQRAEFAHLMQDEAPEILPKIEEFEGVELLRFQEQTRYAPRFWEIEHAQPVAQATEYDHAINFLLDPSAYISQFAPPSETIRTDEREASAADNHEHHVRQMARATGKFQSLPAPQPTAATSPRLHGGFPTQELI